MGEVLTLLKGAAGWLGATERAPGVLWCSKHKIEHTGAAAYLAMLDAYLLQNGAGSLERAERVALRVCERVKTDPAESYIAWIVFPGSRDPNNHANNAIDVGCGIDSIATLARLHGGALGAETLDRIRDNVTKVSDTYILPHARPKEILAQRLWSLAALGSAYDWLKKDDWRSAGLETLEKTIRQQNADGSFPYTPLGTPRSHPGSSDASAFYHSRHALFIAHALLSFGVDPSKDPWASSLRAANEFLINIRKADGLKSTLIEAKPWYWGSPYEVAGFSFDISALAACGRILGENSYISAAAEMFRILQKHVEPDGGVTSHRNAAGKRDWNFQCRFFWNAHLAWVAREINTIESALELKSPPAPAPRLKWFADAGVANYRDDRMVVILRGKSPRRNINHGSPISGGGINHLGAVRDGSEHLHKNPSDPRMAGEWRVLPDAAPSRIQRIKKAFAENRDEIRFNAWIARVRARSGDAFGAVLWYLQKYHRAVCAASRSGYSSGFATNVEGQAAMESLVFRGGVADAFGDAADGIQTIRRYAFERGSVHVGEALVLERDCKVCEYRLPGGALDVQTEGGSPRVDSGIVQFANVKKGAMLSIRYTLTIS
ncbi:MAG: hypothetical protein HY286_05950 [Planctomycetes bacterium]|nr:hypothetical protein [Planctomycetota bacterium]